MSPARKVVLSPEHRLLTPEDLWPLNATVGLLELPFEQTVQAVRDWRGGLAGKHGAHLHRRDLAGVSIDDGLRLLDPLTISATVELFIPTRGDRWTACVNNGLYGAEVQAFTGHLSRVTGTRALTVSVEDEPPVRIGVSFELVGRDDQPRGVHLLSHGLGDAAEHRSIYAGKVDSGRWAFHESGLPLAWEDRSSYTARRIRDRFGPEHLANLCAGLGVDLRDRGYFAPEGRMTLLTQHGHHYLDGEVTLAERQGDRERDHPAEPRMLAERHVPCSCPLGGLEEV